MAVTINGFPGTPSQLTSAVRKALFTSAAVTAMTVGAPGYAAATAGDSVLCRSSFVATINYDVTDSPAHDRISEGADGLTYRYYEGGKRG